MNRKPGRRKNRVRSHMFLLASALVLFSAAAGEPASSDLRISLWHQMSYAGRDVLAELVSAFEGENPGIRVTVLYRETEELRSSFQTAAFSGRGPEVIYGPSDQVGPFSSMGLITDLEPLFEPGFLEQFDPNGLTRLEGKLYQVADRVGNHLTLVYNRDLVPEPPETMTELIAISKRLMSEGRVDYGLAWNFKEPFFFVPFLGGFGGWVMDEENRPTLDTEAAKKAFAFITELRDEHRIIPTECDYDLAETLFKEGKTAFIINGDWSWGGYAKAGIDYGLTRIPKTGEEYAWPSPMVSPKGYSININAEGEALDASVALIEFLVSAESQLAFTEVLNTIPTHLDAAADSAVTANVILAMSRSQAEVGRPMPVVPEMRAVWDAMRPAYQSVLNGEFTPARAAAKMQADAEKKIREMTEEIEKSWYADYIINVVWTALVAFLILYRKRIFEFFRSFRQSGFAYSMIAPSAVVVLLLVFYPFLYNLKLAVSNMSMNSLFDYEVVGFQQFAAVFTEPESVLVFWKTIVWTAVNVVFHVSIGIFLALLLNRRLPGRGIYRTLLILPWAVPQYITALTWRGMFNHEYGAINIAITRYLGMPAVNWLSQPFETFSACILTNIWLGFPFMMIVALGGLQAIPVELYEAADIDGAGWWRKFRSVTLPLLRPAMIPAVTLGIVWTFNNLNIIWLVSGGGEPADKTHILVSYVYKAAFNQYRYGYAAALSIVIFLVLLVFNVIFLKKSKATGSVY